MRKLFFVKKNVNEPIGASNWIEMNVDEFNEFISTEEGKARKNNFAPLFGFGTGDADYYIETTREEVSRIRKENNRHAYLKRLEKESGYVRNGTTKKTKCHQPRFREIRIVVCGGYADTVTVGMQKYVSELTKIKPARFANLNLTACLFNLWFRYMQNSII